MLAALGAGRAEAAGQSHMDPSLVEGGCNACHRGHGAPRSPMLPAPQVELCLTCHGSRLRADQSIMRDNLSSSARPRFLDGVLAQPFLHPLTPEAFSREEAGVVTCTSCHSPHRSTLQLNPLDESGPRRKKVSVRDSRLFEYELCQECHGSAGTSTQNLLDLSRLTNPNNRSFHPVEAPAAGSSPSALPELQGGEINCSDCHGNSDREGPAGPHGSFVQYILRDEYVTVDGADESRESYALCYGCHEREKVLESPNFPLHELHIVKERAACSTCHNAHGSVDNRALVRFGEETHIAGVSPSIQTGRLAFESTAPGSGSCYVTCHGVDHAPMRYGIAAMAIVDDEPELGTIASPTAIEKQQQGPRPRPKRRPERQDPPE